MLGLIVGAAVATKMIGAISSLAIIISQWTRTGVLTIRILMFNGVSDLNAGANTAIPYS